MQVATHRLGSERNEKAEKKARVGGGFADRKRRSANLLLTARYHWP